MDRIYCIGDEDTVSAMSLGDVEGIIVDVSGAGEVLKEIIAREDAALVLITAGCAAGLDAFIGKHNLEKGRPLICEMPGIHDEEGFRNPLLRYVTEALGVSL